MKILLGDTGMNKKEIHEIYKLIDLVQKNIPEAMNSVQHYHLEGMEMALNLMVLMDSDPEEYSVKKKRLFKIM